MRIHNDTIKLLELTNRVSLLQSRPKENYNIVKKLQRRIRKLQNKEVIAVMAAD